MNKTVFFLCLVLTAALSLTLLLDDRGLRAQAKSSLPILSPVGTQVSERIKRIENGLLYPAAIKGQSPVEMKLTDRMRFYNVPGVSIAVINNSAIEWARAYGVKEAGGSVPVTVETLFQAASISKPLVATATLRLVEQGKLRLDEDVNQKLVSWKIPDNEFTKEKNVTLRHLLTHTGGLTNHAVGTYAAEQKLPTLLESLDGQPPARPRPVRVDFVPGSRWRYSGGGYSVLQQLLIDVTGKTFPALMQEAVLGPLKMTHSFYQQPLSQELGALAAAGHRFSGEMVAGRWMILPEMAAGGLWSTPSDLAQFVIELQKAFAGKSNRVLSAAITKQMLTPQIAEMGIGISLRGKGKTASFNHGGSNPGYRCFMAGYAETGQGAVVMTNSDLGDNLVQEIFRSIAKEYGWPDYQPIIHEIAKVAPSVFETYVGQYQYAPGRIITVTTEQGHLFAQDNREFKSEIFPESPTRFFSLLYNTEFRFITDEKGQASEMIVRWMGDSEDVKAKKIK